MTSIRAVRRSASLAAVAALAGGALVAGSGTATADTVADITGVVTNTAGTPLADATVAAYVQNGNSAPIFVDSIATDATGRYTFTDLDAATRAADYPGADADSAAIRSASSFKLRFSRGVPDAELHSNPGYLAVGYGGERSLARSTAVPVNGTTASTANQALPAAAGLVVRITGPSGAPVTDDGFVDLFVAGALDPIDANATTPTGSTSSDDDFYDNPATPTTEPAPVDGLVYVYGIDPGTYAVNATGSDAATATTPFRSYLSRFIGGDGSYATASEFTLNAGAFTSTAVQLSNVLSSLKAPRIIGNSSFGSTLSADPGVFLRQQGTQFSYTWTRNGTPVATGPTYAVTKADKKKKIGLTVLAASAGDQFFGSAAAEPTGKVGEKSTVKATSSDYSFTVTVKAAKKKVAKRNGAVTGRVVLLTEDGEVASRRAKVKNGTATVAPRRQFLGEKKFTVTYLGAKKLGSDTVVATLKGGSGKGGKNKGGKNQR